MTEITEAYFADQLFEEVLSYRNKFNDNESSLSAMNDSKLPPLMIIHWLRFAVYYEKAAAIFIGHWMKTTREDDAFLYFAYQLEDEANHYRWLKKHLQDYVADVDSFVPPPEWSFLMNEYYLNLPSLISRLAAHNIAAETGALGFAEATFHKMPQKIQKTMKQVIKDEKYHVSFAMKLLNKYCITDEQKAHARTSAFESLHYMEKARLAFINGKS